MFVSWRLLASDEPDIEFNVYRITDGVITKLNSEVLTGGTNYTDTIADMTKDNTYYVTTVYNGVETPTDGKFTLKAGLSVAGDKNNAGAAQIIPIKEGGTIHFVWIGDFNGDGAYDFLVDRCADDHQKLEAYLNDGTAESLVRIADGVTFGDGNTYSSNSGANVQQWVHTGSTCQNWLSFFSYRRLWCYYTQDGICYHKFEIICYNILINIMLIHNNC